MLIKRKSPAIYDILQEYSGEKMSTDFSEQSRAITLSSDTDRLLLKSKDFSERVFKRKEQEIESLLYTEQTSSPEQILDYLEMHKQYQDGLEHIFFPETQSSSTQIQLPRDRVSRMVHILSKLKYDINSTPYQGSLISPETQTCHNFLQEYNISLKKSILLLKKLYPILKERADDLEITVSGKIDLLEIKVEKTYSLMAHLLRIAEYMRNWSSQLIHDPKDCDLDEFAFMQPTQIEPTKKKLEKRNTAMDERLRAQEEKKHTSSFDQYKTLTHDFNSMIDICIEEIQDFKELTTMLQPGGRLERIHQRANEQELSLNTTHKTSLLRIERWKEWRDGIVKYLSGWASKKPLPSDTAHLEYCDLETGGQYAKK